MTSPAKGLIDTILTAVKAGDSQVIEGFLAEQVVLHTPRFLRPITDRTHFKIVLQSIPKVLENFRYERTWAVGDEAIMEFRGSIGKIEVHGLDIFHIDANGKVDELTVFIRPTKAHAALAEAEDALVIAEMQRIQNAAQSA